MAKEICISSTPHETRLAILEDDQLAEIYYERENEYTLAGSIYNGRVTRVLPGMQSAFVDVGLERDAFLYVTDFMELDDPEETDEVEKAAASGSTVPPREIRPAPGPGRSDARAEERSARTTPKSDLKPEQRPEQRPDRSVQDRQAKDRRLLVEAAPETGDLPALPSASFSPQPDSADEDSGGPGAKRWRGRRRRRGGRGAAPSAEAQETQDSSVDYAEASSASIEDAALSGQEVATEIHASVAPTTMPRAGHAPAPTPAQHTPAPFVLPGESLSKYGGAPAGDAPKLEPASAPVPPAGGFKPASLIEAPLAWDGSGLLPGESLSKHRKRETEPAVDAEPRSVVSHSPEAGSFSPGAVAELEFVEETIDNESAPNAVQDSLHAEPTKNEDPIEETTEAADAEPRADAVAYHNVDPLPPTGFRLFGRGKKAKDEQPAPEPTQLADGKPASVPSVSAYAPGTVLIEEELIEEEGFVAPRPHRLGNAEDMEQYEEETLPPQIRSGGLGELLQEAQFERRIQLNLEDKNGDEEDAFDDEDEPSAGGQTAGGQSSGAQRRGKVRRGRGAQAGQQAQANRRGGTSRRSMQTSDLPIISDLLKPGQEILVQIAKEPIAMKGARITSHIALPGRFLVFMPTVTHIGVSRKIESDTERQRLKRILVNERGEASGGFIVRTAAEGASEEDLRADLRFLLNLWADIKQRSESSKSPAPIYHDLSLIERILRDQVSSNFTNIWVDTEANYERIVRFLNHFSPTLTRRVKLYTKETPLFEHFGIQDEISKALRSKVWLKSGGSIVINQTEALVAIDINTGKYVGKSARLEDTIVKTNLDAVPEIVRQIRLRDLGGIIVIDFIDMDDRKNRFRVMAALEEALKSDRAPTKVLQFNDFGLVAITRKRVKQSLERTLSVPCPTCQATGMVKSPTTVCNEIYVELRKMKKHFEGADVLLRVNPETVKVLKSNNGSWLAEFEELVGKNILIKSDATLHPEQFDIQG